MQPGTVRKNLEDVLGVMNGGRRLDYLFTRRALDGDIKRRPVFAIDPKGPRVQPPIFFDIFGYPGAAGMQQDGQIINQGLKKPVARLRARAFGDQSQRSVFIGSLKRALMIVVKGR